MILRPYQIEADEAVHRMWGEGKQNVLLVEPTGAGKTVIVGEIIRRHQGPSCAIAHRQELVSQISLAYARNGILHRIIGTGTLVKACVAIHMAEVGNSYYDPRSKAVVAGIDTLLLRVGTSEEWARSVTLWVIDEAHHLLKKNKWGKVLDFFPNARGLGVSATPVRSDGKGLSRSSDGGFDAMHIGPTMRDLINLGYLSDYRVFAPFTQMDLESVKLSSSGEYNQFSLVPVVKKSSIVGDIVKEYLARAKGKLGITFAVSIEMAETITDAYNAAGVPAKLITSKTPDAERAATLRLFKARRLLQLVNVDLFGEGFDLPAIEVVSMGRPTMSYGLYTQQFGRALRIMEGKDRAIIIDHVGNVVRHGLPDRERRWTMEPAERKASTTADDVIPVRACPSCSGVYERFMVKCPYCAYAPVPAARSGPKEVDGDLVELTEEVLAAMRGEVYKIDKPTEVYRDELIAKHVPPIGQMALVKKHKAKQDAQAVLREEIGWWAAYQRQAGRSDRESYKLFYLKFGIDVLSAQALGVTDADELTIKVRSGR